MENMGSKLASIMIILVLIALAIGLGSAVQHKKTVTEQAQDCEDGGGYLIKSFRKKHEVWICLTDFTEILVKEPSE